MLIEFANGRAVPDVAAILNTALIVQENSVSRTPLYLRAGNDTLLLLLYYLIGILTGSQTSEAYRRYSRELFDSLELVGPPSDLVEKLRQPQKAEEVRRLFLRKGDHRLKDLLAEAAAM